MKLAMKEPRPGASQGGLWLQASHGEIIRNQVVSVVYQWCSRLLWDVSAVGRVFRWILPKESLKWDGNKMKSGMGEVVLTLVKLETNSNTSIKQYLVFGANSPWQRLVMLAWIFWWWTWLYVSVANRVLSFQISHGLPSFLSTGPCRSIESQQNRYWHQLERQWNWQERSQGLVLGRGVCGSRLRNGEIERNKMESSGFCRCQIKNPPICHPNP